MIIEIEGECSWDGCQRKATHVAAFGDISALKVGVFCEDHAYDAAQGKIPGTYNPEYVAECPNCGCLVPI